MSKVVIKVEQVGKQYRLGTVGTGTLSHDFNRWWHKIRGKEDPYLKIGEANDRSKKGNSDWVWALKDISFEVRQGEVLGIIGKNGAGKSTLLKILSQVTTPSVGQIKVKGRIASLLEVGTGFHPELTGRENIFLNGAILGMSKQEIKNKFDEIVDFSGVERYIDTPVKRYSSGMYVRLAFAVAAHLEPEILIVDEVLAVGDAEFQKKCLGKMKDVSGQGRTVLFVSHNLPSMRMLCDTGVFIENGLLKFSGSFTECSKRYLQSNDTVDFVSKVRKGSGRVLVTEIELLNSKFEPAIQIVSGQEIIIRIKYKNLTGERIFDAFVGLIIKDENNSPATFLATDEVNKEFYFREEGGIFEFRVSKFLLRAGNYQLSYLLSTNSKLVRHHDVLDNIEGAIGFTVEPGDFWNSGRLNRPRGYIQDFSFDER